jgi:hypothetical protein
MVKVRRPWVANPRIYLERRLHTLSNPGIRLEVSLHTLINPRIWVRIALLALTNPGNSRESPRHALTNPGICPERRRHTLSKFGNYGRGTGHFDRTSNVGRGIKARIPRFSAAQSSAVSRSLSRRIPIRKIPRSVGAQTFRAEEPTHGRLGAPRLAAGRPRGGSTSL